MLGFSLAVFVYIYLLLLVVDIWLMRRYARLDPSELWHRAASVRVWHVTSR
jgi:cytochrome bd-type quinol oxidase subunit 1